jgi:hypothetical protein
MRYMAEFQFRFNRRFDLAALMPRLLRACASQTPTIELTLRTAMSAEFAS